MVQSHSRRSPTWKTGRMTPPPETRYAKNGDVHIAFQTLGNGPLDLVVVPEWVTHVEAAWEHPATARFLRRLATFGRLIMFDKRGVGLSDPVSVTEVPSLETWRDDLGAVLDAVGSQRAVFWAMDTVGKWRCCSRQRFPIVSSP